jgi:hypothetical protein
MQKSLSSMKHQASTNAESLAQGANFSGKLEDNAFNQALISFLLAGQKRSKSKSLFARTSTYDSAKYFLERVSENYPVLEEGQKVLLAAFINGDLSQFVNQSKKTATDKKYQSFETAKQAMLARCQVVPAKPPVSEPAASTNPVSYAAVSDDSQEPLAKVFRQTDEVQAALQQKAKQRVNDALSTVAFTDELTNKSDELATKAIMIPLPRAATPPPTPGQSPNSPKNYVYNTRRNYSCGSKDVTLSDRKGKAFCFSDLYVDDKADDGSELTGDNLKSEILRRLGVRLNSLESYLDIETFKNRFKTSAEYAILKTGQNHFGLLFGTKTGSAKCADKWIDAKLLDFQIQTQP